MSDVNVDDLIEFSSPSNASTRHNAMLINKSNGGVMSQRANKNLLDTSLTLSVDKEETCETSLVINTQESGREQAHLIDFDMMISPKKFDHDNGDKKTSSANNTSNENNSNDDDLDRDSLDAVDFIEVSNDLINVDQEDFWLCDPKATLTSNSQTNGNKNATNKSTNQSKPSQVLNDIKNNINTTNNLNVNDDANNKQQQQQQHQHQQQQQQQQKKNKNPYKWIMEEFEDKNLDKVKRTLLVTLDDISKGFNRRSRSVSTTRTPYYNNSNNMNPNNYHHYNIMNAENQNNDYNIYQQQFVQQQQQQQQQQQLQQNYMAQQLPPPHPTHQQQQNQQSHTSPTINIQLAKSIESILNESRADVIDASANFENKQALQSASSSNNYNAATIVKKKHSNTSNLSSSNGISGSNSSLVQQHVGAAADVDFSISNNQNNDENLSPDSLSGHEELAQHEQKQYEDVIDVQVIAKMQEESLRQSVLNLNNKDNLENSYMEHGKHVSGAGNTSMNGTSKFIKQSNHRQHPNFSSATITKRIHNAINNNSSNRPLLNALQQQQMQQQHHLPLYNFDYENSSSLRRDSASSSEHSSLSSTSNFESPYASHANVNEFYWDEDVIAPTSQNQDLLLASHATSASHYLNCPCCCCASAPISIKQQHETTSSILQPCNDHHLHYHHQEPFIVNGGASKANQQAASVGNDATTQRGNSARSLHNHHLNFIELQQREKVVAGSNAKRVVDEVITTNQAHPPTTSSTKMLIRKSPRKSVDSHNQQMLASGNLNGGRRSMMPHHNTTTTTNDTNSHNYNTITKSTTITHGISSPSLALSNQKLVQQQNGLKPSSNSVSRSTTPSKASLINGVNRQQQQQVDSRLPTPRSSRSSVDRLMTSGTGVNGSQLNMAANNYKSKSPSSVNRQLINQNKPPPVPTLHQTPSSSTQQPLANTRTVNSRTGRVILPYGSQRSATTSVVQSSTASSVLSSRLNQMQRQQLAQQHQNQLQQQFLLQQQQLQMQQNVNILKNGINGIISRASTNQSIASSNSSSALSSTNASHMVNTTSSSIVTAPSSTTSPSSVSSMSASSSIQQIAPMNASSPRSRNQSPSSNLNNKNIVISPSGLLTDGPLGRRPIINRSPMRERSTSPVYDKKQMSNNSNGGGSQMGSNQNLHTIQEAKIPMGSSPLVNRKQTQPQQVPLSRKSFLPQPVQQQQQQQQQHIPSATTQKVMNRRPSESPIRSNPNLYQQPRNVSPTNNWKDGCF